MGTTPTRVGSGQKKGECNTLVASKNRTNWIELQGFILPYWTWFLSHNHSYRALVPLPSRVHFKVMPIVVFKVNFFFITDLWCKETIRQFDTTIPFKSWQSRVVSLVLGSEFSSFSSEIYKNIQRSFVITYRVIAYKSLLSIVFGSLFWQCIYICMNHVFWKSVENITYWLFRVPINT